MLQHKSDTRVVWRSIRCWKQSHLQVNQQYAHKIALICTRPHTKRSPIDALLNFQFRTHCLGEPMQTPIRPVLDEFISQAD